MRGRPRAVHVVKLAEFTGALSNYVAGADSQSLDALIARGVLVNDLDLTLP